MSNNAIVRRGEVNEIIPNSFGDLMDFAEVAYHSGMFPSTKSIAAAGMKIAAGAELGLAPVASLRSLHVIEGKVEMSAHLMLALCKKAGYKIKVLRADDQACSLEWYSPDGELCGPPVGFSRKQAQDAGLMNRKNWTAYTEDMLWARAVSRGARRYCSDVMHGIYVEGEISDSDRPQRSSNVVPAAARTNAAPDRCPDCQAIISSGDCDCPPAPTRPTPTPTPTTAPTTVDAIVSDPLRSGAMRKLHAVAKERGLNHDDLRDALGCESIKDLSTDDLSGAAMLLECIGLTQLKATWSNIGSPALSALKDWCKGDLEASQA